MRKLILIFLGFYFLILIQTSFLVHFNFGWRLGFLPILIIITLINFFEPTTKKSVGGYSAFFGGLFLDIFSENFFGFWIFISLVLSFFIKFIFKKHVRLPI